MANKPDDNSVFHFTVFDQVSITYRLFIGIVQAAIYKHRHSMVHVKLPEIKTPQTYKQEALDSLIHQVMTKIDTLVKLSIHFTTRKCFFRSYAAACVLRRYGIGVALNMGLHHLNKKHQRVRGHCWLTLQGRPIAEKVNPRINFSQYIGGSGEDIYYWIGGDQTDKDNMVRGRELEQEMGHAA